MGSFLDDVFETLRDWHVAEAGALRNAAIFLIMFPLLLLFSAAIAEAVFGFQAKVLLVAVANIVMGVTFVWMAVQRVLVAIEVGTPILSARRVGDDSTPLAIADAATFYARGVAAVLASETAVGLAVVLLPVHTNIPVALLMLSTSITFLSWWAWKNQGLENWAKAVYNLASANLFLGLVLIVGQAYIPQALGAVYSSVGLTDSQLAESLRHNADILVVAIVIGKLLALAFVAVPLISGKLASAGGRILAVTILLLLFSMGYRVWKGDGEYEKMIREKITSSGSPKPVPPPNASSPTLTISVSASNPGDLGVLLKADEGKRVTIDFVDPDRQSRLYKLPGCAGKHIRAEVMGGPWDPKLPVVLQWLEDGTTSREFRDVPAPFFRDSKLPGDMRGKLAVVPLKDLGPRLEGGGQVMFDQNVTFTLWCEPIA